MIKEIVEQIAHDVRFLPKYGGEVLVHGPESDKKFVSGIYVYKDHVSLEFYKARRSTIPMGGSRAKVSAVDI